MGQHRGTINVTLPHELNRGGLERRVCYHEKAVTSIEDLALLIQSRHPLIAAETREEERFERTLQQVAESLRAPFYQWSLTEGLRRLPNSGSVYDTHEPLKVLNNIAAMTGEALFFMKDLRRFLDKPEIVRRVLDIAPHFTMDRRVIVLLAAKDALPAELQSFAASYAFALPSATELKAAAKALIERLRRERPIRVELNDADLDACIDRLRGMSAFEAERTLFFQAIRPTLAVSVAPGSSNRGRRCGGPCAGPHSGSRTQHEEQSTAS